LEEIIYTIYIHHLIWLVWRVLFLWIDCDYGFMLYPNGFPISI